ncbi:hypothetical protein FB451DRAFT_1553002 [Mycena latifolia]|nr:hypothetical protein FB451DRAFT_1553002 [Mycena latifolia]
MSATSSIIDDRASTVSYTGTWVVGGTSHEHAGTVSSSVNAGDHFSVPFTGTGISVYGTFDSSSAGVKTSYTIDGGSATTVTSSSSGADSYQQLFWKSDAVSSGDHNLVVTMVSVNDVGDGEGTVWFDYFNVTSALSTPSSSSSSGFGSSSSSSAAAAGHTSKTSTATSAGSSASTSSTAVAGKKSSSHTIAAVVVIVLVVALICVGFFFWRKRKQPRYTDFLPSAKMSSAMSGPPPTQPFLPNPTPMTPMSGFAGSASVLAAPYGSPAPSPFPGGFDPHAPHAPPAGGAYAHPGQACAPPPGAPYGGGYPGAAFAAASAQAAYNPHRASASYAASSSSAPSSSQRGPLSVVGSTAPSAEYGDSIADLKRRQQQVVDSYEQGISGAHTPPIQHVDSGVRALDPAAPSELPPVYTPN